MTQKIDPFGADIAGSRATAPVARPSAPGSRAKDSVQPTAQSDSVQLTGEAVSMLRLENELRTAGAFDSARVQAVRSALDSGSYQVNSDVVAGRLIDLERMLNH